ncbi:MAG: nodulation protein NfeD [Pirellulales bacterium]
MDLGSVAVVAKVVRWAVLAGVLGLSRNAGLAQEANPDVLPQAEPADVDAKPVIVEKRVGRVISIPAPLTSSIETRVRHATRRILDQAKHRGEWPVLIFEIGQGPNKLGITRDLAEYISSLSGATTVAWLPEGCHGHSLLLAMACEQIAMPGDMQIGEAGSDEPMISDAMRSQYAEIAARRRSIPSALALGMLDPQLEVWKVETETSTEYVLAENLEALRKNKTFVLPPAPLIPRGEAGKFTGVAARDLRIVNYLAPDRGVLVQALGLPRSAALDDVAGAGDLHAVRIDIKGPVTSASAGQVQGVIDRELRNEVNFFCFAIDSPGGSPQDTINSLANFINGPGMAGRRTVAYISHEARADAAIMALACDEIVMAPTAKLGGDGPFEIAEADVPLVVDAVKQICKAKFRSWSLPAAIVQKQLAVYRYQNTKDGRVEYFCEQEAREQLQPADWQQGEEVKSAGGPLLVDGLAAEQYGLSSHTVESFAEFKALYGLEDDPRLAESGWADVLIDALTRPEVAWLLLVIGGAAMVAELHSPGVGVGGFIAAVCFVTFFWAKFLGGTAGWLEVLLFVTGLVCVLLELFVLPGFGVFGLGGGLLIISSLVLASQTFTQLPRNSYQLAELRNSVLVVAGAGASILGVMGLLNRYLPKTPGLNRMILFPPTAAEQADIARRESVASYEYLVGREGTTTTPLTPAGKARFDGQLVEVIADGEMLDRGTRISVIEARGNHVLVKAVG